MNFIRIKAYKFFFEMLKEIKKVPNILSISIAKHTLIQDVKIILL